MQKKLETTISILGLPRDDGKGNVNYYIGCWGYLGIMEKDMESTIISFIGFRAWSLAFRV